jgi:type II secretory pathway component GspD/PulD (secretin)
VKRETHTTLTLTENSSLVLGGLARNIMIVTVIARQRGVLKRPL